MDLLVDLLGQLTRRRQNQNERRARATGRGQTQLVNALDDGQRKRKRLSLSRRGTTNQVLSIVNRIKRLRLDRKQFSDALRIQNTDRLRRDAITRHGIEGFLFRSIHRTRADAFRSNDVLFCLTRRVSVLLRIRTGRFPLFRLSLLLVLLLLYIDNQPVIHVPTGITIFPSRPLLGILLTVTTRVGHLNCFWVNREYRGKLEIGSDDLFASEMEMGWKKQLNGTKRPIIHHDGRWKGCNRVSLCISSNNRMISKSKRLCNFAS